MDNINATIDTEEVAKESPDLVSRCKRCFITNQQQYETSAGLLNLIKEQKERIGLAYDSIVEKAHQAHKEAVAKRKEYLDPLEDAKKFVNKLMVDYVTEQERLAKIEQKRLQDILDKAAEAEKKKLEAKIERAEASGKEEKAEALKERLDNVAPVSAPVIAPQIETPKGISYKDNWTAKIIDPNLVPREWCIPDEKTLNAFAK